MTHKVNLTWPVLVVALSAAPLAAHASDGVIEINHARALAGGITPGDTAGYPVTVSQSGSYRLTSNLSQPDANTHVVQITANDVSIDLNGFRISGANVCTQPAGPSTAVTCTGTGNGAGVRSTGANTTVRNGTVSGMAGNCVGLPVGFMSSAVYDLMVSQCGSYGISATNVFRSQVRHALEGGIHGGSLVADSVAESNGNTGIDGRLVRNSGSIGNHGFGIDGVLVTGCVSDWNGVAGIALLDGMAIGNSISRNVGGALVASSASAATQNVITSSSGLIDSPVASLPANSNLCNGAPC